MTTFGKKVLAAEFEKKISQKRLSELTGLSPKTIQRIEQDHPRVTKTNKVRVASILEIDYDPATDKAPLRRGPASSEINDLKNGFEKLFDKAFETPIESLKEYESARERAIKLLDEANEINTRLERSGATEEKNFQLFKESVTRLSNIRDELTALKQAMQKSFTNFENQHRYAVEYIDNVKVNYGSIITEIRNEPSSPTRIPALPRSNRRLKPPAKQKGQSLRKN